ncbi:MAG: hypothetical protein MZV70_55860 [Desulfobacterales bacterium]|nr:hypothetical protein [Desulfobacterales bacterium]
MNPYALTFAFLRAAKSAGARILTGVEVKGIEVAAGKATGGLYREPSRSAHPSSSTRPARWRPRSAGWRAWRSRSRRGADRSWSRRRCRRCCGTA